MTSSCTATALTRPIQAPTSPVTVMTTADHPVPHQAILAVADRHAAALAGISTAAAAAPSVIDTGAASLVIGGALAAHGTKTAVLLLLLPRTATCRPFSTPSRSWRARSSVSAGRFIHVFRLHVISHALCVLALLSPVFSVAMCDCVWPSCVHGCLCLLFPNVARGI